MKKRYVCPAFEFDALPAGDILVSSGEDSLIDGGWLYGEDAVAFSMYMSEGNVTQAEKYYK